MVVMNCCGFKGKKEEIQHLIQENSQQQGNDFSEIIIKEYSCPNPQCLKVLDSDMKNKLLLKSDKKKRETFLNFRNNLYISKCEICKEEIKPDEQLKKLRCDHTFHQGCILIKIKEQSKSISNKLNCPYCNTNLTPKESYDFQELLTDQRCNKCGHYTDDELIFLNCGHGYDKKCLATNKSGKCYKCHREFQPIFRHEKNKSLRKKEKPSYSNREEKKAPNLSSLPVNLRNKNSFPKKERPRYLNPEEKKQPSPSPQIQFALNERSKNSLSKKESRGSYNVEKKRPPSYSSHKKQNGSVNIRPQKQEVLRIQKPIQIKISGFTLLISACFIVIFLVICLLFIFG